MDYCYQSLNLDKSEIRILRFVDPPANGIPDIVYCTLQNVSLDDYLPEFSQYLESERLDCDPKATRSWVKFIHSPRLTLASRRAPQGIPLAHWRLKGDIELDLQSFGVESATLPSRYGQENVISRSSNAPRPPTPEIRDCECTLVPTRFTWGDFEALSYCWGSDVRNKIIMVDGRRLKIASNLEAFLQKLRKLPEARAGMGFWADGVCIRQDDNKEKNHQVKLMKRIYTQAYSTIIWLGPFDGPCEETMRVLAHAAYVGLVEVNHTGAYWWLQSLTDVWSADSFDEWFRSLPLQSLVEILTREYWGRMWIIQELALNDYMTIVMCGDLELSRVMIQFAAMFCSIYSAKIRKALQSGSTAHQVSADMQRMSSMDLWQLGYDVTVLLRGDLQVAEILDLARKSKVKKSQDKIYGMLGLLSDHLVQANQPNYDLKYRDVYIQFAKSLLLQPDSCRLDDLLAWCSYESACTLSDAAHVCSSMTNQDVPSTFNNQTIIPSWVPNWMQQFPRNHVQWLKMRRAAKDLSAKFSFHQSESTVLCRGLFVDEIESIGRSSSEYIPFRTQLPQRGKGKPSRKQFGKYCDQKGLTNALKRTITCDHPSQKEIGNVFDIYWIDWDTIRNIDPSNEQLKDLWYGLRTITDSQENHSSPGWQAFDRFRHTNANFDIFGHSLREFFPDMREYVRPTMFRKPWTLWPYPEVRPDDDYYHRELNEDDAGNMSLTTLTLVGRRLITTRSEYLGLAPEAAQQGDRVAILFGCNFPVILRPAGNSYLYIGECYIDGLMEGEAIDAQEIGEYDVVDINIC